MPVNAVRGYLDMTSRLVTDRHPIEVVHVLDGDWRPAWRVAAYPGYKAARRPDPPDLPPQSALLRRVLAAAGVPVVEDLQHEADDVIGTLAARATPQAPLEVVTGDRDMFQVIRDGATRVLFTVRGVSALEAYDEAAVQRRYGVPPRLYAEMAMLRGDPSDGLPGVRGVGESTAARLVAEHGGLDGVLAAKGLPPRLAAALDAHREYLEAMRRVVPVVTDLAVTVPPRRSPDVAALQDLAARHGLGGAVDRLLSALATLP